MPDTDVQDQTDQTDDLDRDPGQTDGDQQSDDGADQLGDAGKQALDRMKGQLKTTKAELRAFKALGLTPEQIQALQKPADDAGDKPDPEKIRDEARREARAEAQRERVVDKIEAKARGFADPEDAVAILLRTHDADDFLDGDKIDVEAIQEALDELLEKKPHLAAAAQGGRRFSGGADGGARKESRPDQLTRDDLKRLSPREIEAARKAGRLNDLLGIKS